MKKNMRYLSASGKKSLTMRLSEMSELFRIVFREIFEHLEIYPIFDEVLSNSLFVQCVTKHTYPFSQEDFKKLRYQDSKYFGHQIEDVAFEADFLEHDSIYMAKVNCGKYICDLQQDKNHYTQLAYQIASFFCTVQNMEHKRQVKQLSGYRSLRYFLFFTTSKIISVVQD